MTPKSKAVLTVLLFVLLGLLFLSASPSSSKAIPSSCNGQYRGIRNNNPGNLVISSSDWKGKVPLAQNTDGRFEQFTAWIWGVRAMVYLIRKYLKTNRNTIDAFLTSYAGVGAQSSYGQFLQAELGISPYTPIHPTKNNIEQIAYAVSKFESGCRITKSNFEKAWQLL